MEIRNDYNRNITTVTSSSSNLDAGKNENVGEDIMEKDSKKIDNKEYSAISKDGDTLEITMGSENDIKGTKGASNEGSITQKSTSKKMTDATLAKCSKGKLMQLLQNGHISKQQYEKAMKKQSIF